MSLTRWTVGVLLGATCLSPVHAQTAPAPVAPPPEESEALIEQGLDDTLSEEEADEAIVVTGQRLPGAVEGNVEPEAQLGPRDIRAYGASNLAELVEALAPLTGSTRGRGGGGPVILLNGKRIAGFSQIRGLPPEAILRVDILPEEVALSYGYRADQRVINFVLRPRFRATTVEVEQGFATAGGRTMSEVDLNFLRINRDGRWSLEAEYERNSALLESERDLIQSTPARPFDLLGNVASADSGSEIDPALSALAGEPVTVAALPAGGGLSLADFAAGANDPRLTSLARYRSLLPETERLELSGTLSRTIFGDVTAATNVRFTTSQSESRLGLAPVELLIPSTNPFSPFAADSILYRYSDAGGALLRGTRSRTAHVDLGLNGDLSGWRWTFTANYDFSRAVTRTDRGLETDPLQARLLAGDATLNPFVPLNLTVLSFLPQDRVRNVSHSADAQLVANGTLLRLPAGPARANFRIGADWRSVDNQSLRGGAQQTRDFSRRRVAAQANLDLPIASRSREIFGAIGDLSANLNGEVEQYSDAGALLTFGYGLRWEPIEPIDLSASMTHEQGAPTPQQLGDPFLATPNVRVFDFVRGETVDITRLEGGNPDLREDSRREINLRLNARPFGESGPSFVANYTNSRVSNPIASFPTATPEIEAAFPERFVRDDEGRLLQIDARPVNFTRSERSEVRWGLNWSKPIGPQGPTPAQRAEMRRQRQAARAAGEASPTGPAGSEAPDRPRRWQGGGGGRGFGGRGFGGRGFGGGGQGGRLLVSLHHNWRLKDEILIRPGLPVLDLLGGSAAGNRGGRPRHAVEARLGLFRNGLGGRIEANWESGTRVSGGRDGDLFFSPVTTVNLRLFADLSAQRRLVRDVPLLRGSRIGLEVDNLFDSRPQVRDALGETPLGYQPDYLDPLGRTVKLTLRKMFF